MDLKKPHGYIMTETVRIIREMDADESLNQIIAKVYENKIIKVKTNIPSIEKKND